jgi:ubiquitin carboxyl-terminal hydrolase 25/28
MLVLTVSNTCYLNSVLQFLYAIKPVREAVMSFEERDPAARGGDESPKEMEQRVKVESSRRCK